VLPLSVVGMNQNLRTIIGSLLFGAASLSAQVQSDGQISLEAQHRETTSARMRTTLNTQWPFGGTRYISQSFLYDAPTGYPTTGFGTAFLTASTGSGGIGVGAFKPNNTPTVKIGAAIESRLTLARTQAKAVVLIPYDKRSAHTFINTKTTAGAYVLRTFGNYDMQKGLLASELELNKSVLNKLRVGIQVNNLLTSSSRSYNVNFTVPYKLK
jgi:hypothetical protein